MRTFLGNVRRSNHGEGERIAIESRFGCADRDHLTRPLAYAVGLRHLSWS